MENKLENTLRYARRTSRCLFLVMQVMLSVRTMAANRLATDGRTWSRILLLQDGNENARQWITLEPRSQVVELIEQMSGITRVVDISEEFAATGALCRTGKASLHEIKITIGENNADDEDDDDVARGKLVTRLQKNVTTMESFRRLLRGYSHEDGTAIITTVTEDEDQTARILAYRGDLEKNDSASPFGVIDAKIVLADVNGVESFEAASGPSTMGFRKPFRWSKTFSNVSHIGHPDVFEFDNVFPLWVWV